MNLKSWISAARLRTLPLAFSCIITGTAIADSYGFFDLTIFVFAIITTLFLQVLSNFSNDFGDAKKGTDNNNRIGPERAIQSGVISLNQMKKAMIVLALLAFVSGIILVFYSTRDFPVFYPIGFVLIGLFSIWAAIKYTAGKKAYGYQGFGDFFVFLFFGLVGVCGVVFLFVKELSLKDILPAITVGLFSVAVLNLNNMRDWENDKECKKYTLVVKLGLKKAKRYHFSILVLGMLSSILYIVEGGFKPINLLFVVSFLPIIFHLRRALKVSKPKEFDPELKKVAITTFLFSILFWISIIQ